MKNKLWGKKNEENGQYYWLPLQQHLIDTSNIMIQLWNHWLSEGQRQYIMKSISDFKADVVSLISFLGLTHDLGKATPCFALRPSRYNQSIDLDRVLIENMIKAGFSGLNNWSPEHSSKTPHALAGQVLLSSYGVGEDIASIVGGHHGKAVDNKWEIKKQLESYAANYYQYDNENEHTKNWKKVQGELFKWALKEAGYKDVEELPKIERPAQVLLQGLLIMADWIASNEEYFPLFTIDVDEEESQEKRLEYGWEHWTKTDPWVPEYPSNVFKKYEERFQFDKPKEIQIGFYEALDKTEEPGIIILEAPMGVGKTEAALLGVEQMAERRKCSSMFFALPTQATSDGIFPRINDWIEKIAQETNDNKSIQLVHGKSQFNDIFQNLKNVENKYEEEGNVVVNEWFTGRKTAILDDFVVGTVDQILLAGLKQKHLALRHLGLSKKVVIIDEVHAFDSYMGVYLYRVIEWLGAYHIPVIILSATLPASRREKLIRTYCQGRRIEKRDLQAEYSDWEKTQAYPLITYTDGRKVNQLRDFHLENTTEVKVLLIKEKELEERILNLTLNGGIVGVIVNTVKRAQILARQLEKVFGKENISVFHSSFLAGHRWEKEKQLMDEIGKNAKRRPTIRIIIGTQVLEQSLDIDFDVLFTDIAPIDLLFQRIGRLHRHRETKRPLNLKRPLVHILGIEGLAEFDAGASKIYGDYLLTRTQLVLSEKLVLPEDISRLVQKVYLESDLEIPQSIKEKYEKIKEENSSKIKSKRNNAKAFLLDRPYSSREKSLIGWLKDNVAKDTEEDGFAKVRDGIDSIEVILIKRKGKDLYLLDNITKINIELTASLAKKISQQTLRLPFVFHYKTDELIEELEMRNIRELSNWQDQPWLKGSLGLILDEDNKTTLLGYKIQYDSHYGLMYEKEEK